DNGSGDACGIAGLSIDNTDFDCSDIGAGPQITELFISEYIEGGGSNKCIEIFNGTGAPVSLTGYQLLFYFNGNISAGTSINLTGTINNGDVYVVCDDGATADFLNNADLASAASFFNGDDAIVLAKSGTPIDIIGRIGQDPGTEWTGGGNSTLDRTLVRNADITSGNTDNALGFPSLATEWTGFANNTSSQLGSHTSNSLGNVVTLTVTDTHGNASTCTATVTVEDNVDPVALCQDVTVQLNAAGAGSTTAVAVDNGSNDACGIQSAVLSQQSFGCADVGTNTVTLTVTDKNGNVSTCSATVTVEDNVAPVALCQDITVQLDENGDAAIDASDINNGSGDACGVDNASVSPSVFDCSNVGANTVTLTLADSNDNSSSCTATVTVEDNVAPTALCKNITVELDVDGNGQTTPQSIDAGSYDACGIQSLGASRTKFDCFDVGVVIVTLTVTDVNNNISACTSAITVVDPVFPEALCRDVTVQLNAAGAGSTTPEAVNNGSSDACGIESLALSQTDFDCSEAGPNTVTLTVEDVNGNISTCTATVTVEDNVPPVALCRNITLQLDQNGNATTTVAAIENGSTDACGIASLGLSQTSFDCADGGAVTVTLTATDVHNNASTCTATITLEDHINPVISCNNITVSFNSEGSIQLDPASMVSADDNCGIGSFEADPPSVDCADLGEVIPVTVTVKDNSGNTVSCVSNVTIAGLPCGWMEMPDGIGCTNGSDGSYNVPTDTYTLTASGCYTPSATMDESGYIKFALCGDGSITARIASLTLPGFAGIVMRESEAPGAKKVAMAYQGLNSIARYVRYTDNGPSYPAYLSTGGSKWLRIVRTGNTFRGYHSVNGVNWIYAFAVTVPMNQCIQVGLIAWGANSNAVVTATFDHVVVNPPYNVMPKVSQQGPLPIDLTTETPGVELWPNPTGGRSTLRLDEGWGRQVSVEIRDEFGKLIRRLEADPYAEQTVEVDLGNHAPGIYLIKVQDEKGRMTALRLVVARP
ncbi:MAG: lamin tail domain-containing protein, partial [Lewinella sp.]|nr:lamin tail domain-containing protein [Lewinella sp.]